MDFKQAGMFGVGATLLVAVLQLFLGFVPIPAQQFFFWAIAVFVVGKFLIAKYDLIPLAVVSIVTAFVMLVADRFVVGEIVRQIVTAFPTLMPTGFILTVIADIVVVAIVFFVIDKTAFRR